MLKVEPHCYSHHDNIFNGCIQPIYSCTALHLSITMATSTFTLNPETDKLPVTAGAFRQFLRTLQYEFREVDDIKQLATSIDDETANNILNRLKTGQNMLRRFKNGDVGAFHAFWERVFGREKESAVFFTITSKQRAALAEQASREFEEAKKKYGAVVAATQKAIGELDGLLQKYGRLGTLLSQATDEAITLSTAQQQAAQAAPAQQPTPAPSTRAQPQVVPSTRAQPQQTQAYAATPVPSSVPGRAVPGQQPQLAPQRTLVREQQQPTATDAIQAERVRLAGLLASVKESGTVLYEALVVAQDAYTKQSKQQLSEAGSRAIVKKLAQMKIVEHAAKSGKELNEFFLTTLLMAAAAALGAWVTKKLAGYFQDRYSSGEPSIRSRTPRDRVDDIVGAMLNKTDNKSSLPKPAEEQNKDILAYATLLAENTATIHKAGSAMGDPTTLAQRCGFSPTSKNAQEASKLLGEVQAVKLNPSPVVVAIRDAIPKN